MATSGSTDFSIDRDTLIKESMEILNAYDPISTMTADEIWSCSRTLNIMLKAMQADGLQLWKQTEVHLFMEADKIKYTLSTSGDNATISHTETAMRVAGAASATTLEVDSTTGMTAGDYIGIELDDDTMHWTTVSSVTDTDTVVITTGLASASAIDNVIYFFTNKIPKPLRINNALIHHKSSGNDVELNIVSREEYWNLGVKTSEGIVNQIYFDPRRDDSEVRVFPEPTSVTDYIILVCHLPFEDFDSGANTPDFPQEWLECVVWGLATRLMFKYGATVPVDRRREIKAMANEMYQKALDFDTEDTSIFLQPDRRLGYNS